MKLAGNSSGAWSFETGLNKWSSSGPNSQSGNFNFDFRNYSALVLMDRQDWVSHNSDGTKSFTSSASVTADLPPGVQTASLSISVSLKTIPRATTPKLPSSFTTGSSGTISLPRASSSFSHQVKYTFGKASGTITNSAGTSVNWNPSRDLAKQIPNAPYGYGHITVVTKNGSTTIGSKTLAYRLNLDSSIIPSIGDTTFTDTNPKTSTIVEQFVQGLSVLKPDFDASGSYGSTITSNGKTINFDGSNYSVDGSTTIIPDRPGSISYTSTVKDSRSRTNSSSGSVEVLAYTPPTIGPKGWGIYRGRSNSTRPTTDGSGTIGYLRLDVRTTALQKAGSNVNFLSIKSRYRPSDGSWSRFTTTNIPKNHSYDGIINIPGPTNGFIETKSYQINVLITDTVEGGVVEIVETLPTTVVAIDMKGNNVGIGKTWERGTLDVSGEAHIEKDLLVSGVSIFDLIPVGVVVPFAGRKPRVPDGWLLCDGTPVSKTEYPELYDVIGDDYSYGSDENTFKIPDLRGRIPVGYDTVPEIFSRWGEKVGAATHTLTTSEMPRHSHGQLVTHTGNIGGVTRRDYDSDGGINKYQQGADTNSTGSGNPHNNVQPSLVMHYIIKAKRSF